MIVTAWIRAGAAAAICCGLATLAANASSPPSAASGSHRPAGDPSMGAAAAAAAKAVGPQLSSVTLIIRHRVFHDFVERSQVRLKQDFPIGASDYSARVTEFVPDFDMDLKTRKVTSRSVEPKNPAFHIVVREKGAPVDTTWAFLHLPPHFTRKSLLAFQVQRIDFVGRPAIVAADSGLSPPDGAATKARKP